MVGVWGVVSLSQFVWALIVSCCTVYIAGYACWELEKALNRRKVSSTAYYRAFRYNNKVYIGISGISRWTAVSRLRTGQDTYTWRSGDAYSIASSVGRGVKGPERHSGRRGVFYNHYHPRSGARFHSFYGYAYVYN